jgi:hypothetical protein
MNAIPFEWRCTRSLPAELRKPIAQISLEFAIPNSGPRSLTLWRPDKTGLRLYTEMHDVAERREVGVLSFEHVSAPSPIDIFTDVAPAFQREITLSKLIVQDSGIKAESGVVLATSTGDELVIVAGAYPYSLAVKGLNLLAMPNVFNPEYPLDRYVRVPIE